MHSFSQSVDVTNHIGNFANVRIYDNISIFRLIESCDVVITNVSTVVLDSMVYGKPSIVVNFDNMSENFSKYNAGIQINSVGQLSIELEKILGSNNVSELIQRQFNFVDKYSKRTTINSYVDKLLSHLKAET